ncbi:MAG TPA: RNA polymerase sigma factor [Candidatus Paceibacterota bacterium]
MRTPNEDISENFIKTYDELADPLYRRFCFRLSNRERSKELVQETFTRSWEYLVEGKEIKNLKSFIYKIANNLIIDEYRKKKSVSLDVMRDDGFDVSTEVDGHESIVKQAETEHMRKAIDQLPPKYREIVVMRYIDGLTLGEISAILGETENTVSVRINRSIKKIQDLLKI